MRVAGASCSPSGVKWEQDAPATFPAGAGLSWRTEGCLLDELIIPPLRGFELWAADPGVTLRYAPGYAHPALAGLNGNDFFFYTSTPEPTSPTAALQG
jgi:hypothetical protein